MSKIVCFVAMAHHSRFLMPVVEALKEKGNERLYFTTASDFPFEAHAYQKGFPCVLLQHYTNEEVRNKSNQAIHKFFDQWKDQVFTLPAARQWPLSSATSLITQAIKEYYHIEEFFKQEKPDLVIALQERNRWGKLFGHLCRKAKIPYMTFQEGDYYQDRLSFSVHTEYSSRMMLWGQTTKDMLVRLGCDPDKMILCGNTHLQPWKQQLKDITKLKEKFRLDPNKKTVVFNVGIQWGVRFSDPQWKNFLYWFKGNPEWQAFISWHPKVTYNSYLTIEKKMKEKFPEVIFSRAVDVYDLIPCADWVVCLGKTTSAVEALYYGKPLITCKGFDGEEDQLYEAKVSQSLEPFRKQNWTLLTREIPQVIQDGSSYFLDNYFYKRNEQAVEIAVQNAEELINGDYVDLVDPEFENRFLQLIKEG